MKEIAIPFTSRIPYLSCDVRTETVEDSRGRKQVVWPLALDLPNELVASVDDGRVVRIACRYPRDLGPTTPHLLMRGRGRFDLHQARGVLAAISVDPLPMLGPGAFDRFADLLARIEDAVRCQPDSETFKWKTIFSVEIVRREWLRGEAPLRRLLSSRSPYR